MIELTRLNGHTIAVNYDIIRYVEANPDTVLTLINGEKLIVRESPAQVIEATFRHRILLLKSTWPESAGAFLAQPSYLKSHTA